MIDTTTTKIWTPHGYVFAEDLYIGQKVISFNPDRGCCEYDQVLQVNIEYKKCMGYGLNAKSMRQVMTPDHPLIYWNNKTKTMSLIPIEERFMYKMHPSRPNGILSNIMFEPYKRTQDFEDIKYSARIAATISDNRRAHFELNHLVNDLGGYEAQTWIDTYFHWNKLRSMGRWMYTVKLYNQEIRDVLFNVAPRAGVGVQLIFNKRNYVSVSETGQVYMPQWLKKPIDGLMFNITTKNGSVLIKSGNGASLIACNKGEKC